MKKVIVLFLFVCSINLFSQTDSIYKFKLPELKITQIEKGKSVTYEFENSPNRFMVSDSFLTANPKKYKYKVKFNDIKKITIVRSNNIAPVMVLFFALGGLLGAGVAGFGMHSSPDTGERIEGALYGGVILSLIAGGVALLISHDKEYDLSKMDIASKKNMLKKILNENKLE